MGAIFNKIDPSQSIKCSSCNIHSETETHLYRCPTRRAAMEDVFLDETLCDFLEENHTSPALAYTLLEALYSDLRDDRYPKFSNRHGANDPKYRKLHQTQAYIGWSQLFQGRLVKDWSQLQEEFIDQNNADMKLDRRYYSGTIWARKLINLLWSTVREQWDDRNADRHGRTKAANHAIRHERLLNQITAQQAEAPGMLAADRDLLSEPITAKQKRSPNALELWVKRTRPIVKLSTKDAIAAIARTHNSITQFFSRRKKPIGTPTKQTRRSLDRSNTP
jgi:hypothetical protein